MGSDTKVKRTAVVTTEMNTVMAMGTSHLLSASTTVLQQPHGVTFWVIQGSCWCLLGGDAVITLQVSKTKLGKLPMKAKQWIVMENHCTHDSLMAGPLAFGCVMFTFACLCFGWPRFYFTLGSMDVVHFMCECAWKVLLEACQCKCVWQEDTQTSDGVVAGF